MDNKICVYAICKNESKFVDQWLDSMSEADYVVVLDTGSDDDTYDKLINDSRVTKTAQMSISPFRFDLARNESLKLVPEDATILVCTDFDEVFETGWSDVLKQNWSDQILRVKYTYVWDHTDSGDPRTVFWYDKIHTKDYKWYYPVHEVLGHVNGLTLRPEDEVGRTLDLQNQIILHHYQDITKERSNYLDLLKLRYEEDTKDSYSLYLLGREYGLVGQYEESLECFEKVLSLDDLVNYPLVHHATLGHIGNLYRLLGQNSESILCYNLQIQYDKTYREPYICLAEIYNDLELYEIALGYAKEAFSSKVYRHYDWSEDSAIWCGRSYDVISISYSGLKKYEDSLKFIIKALQFDPFDERIRNNYLQILSKIQ